MSPLENIFLALLTSSFGNLRRHGFAFVAHEGTPVSVTVEAISESTAIQWIYGFPDEFITCYVLPVHNGMIDRDYCVDDDTVSWELSAYCKEVLNIGEAKLDAIEQGAFARIGNRLQSTLAYYKKIFALLDLEQLKEGRSHSIENGLCSGSTFR